MGDAYSARGYSEKTGLTKVVGNVKTRWAWFADTGEIFLTPGKITRVNEFSQSENDQLVKECNDVATRLVNCKNNCTIIVAGKVYETFHDVVRIECVKTCKIYVNFTSKSAG